MLNLFKTILKLICITALVINSAGQGYALRPMATAVFKDTFDLTTVAPETKNTKSSSAGKMEVLEEEIEDYAWLSIVYQGTTYAVDFHRKAPEGEDIPDIDITTGTMGENGEYSLKATYYRPGEITSPLHQELIMFAFSRPIIQEGLKKAIWRDFAKRFEVFLIQKPEAPPEEELVTEGTLEPVEPEFTPAEEVVTKPEAPFKKPEPEEQRPLAPPRFKPSRPTTPAVKRPGVPFGRPGLRKPVFEEQKPSEPSRPGPGWLKSLPVKGPETPAERPEPVSYEPPKIIKRPPVRVYPRAAVDKGDRFKDAVVIEVSEDGEGVRISLRSTDGNEKEQGTLMYNMMSEETKQRKLKPGDKIDVEVRSTKKGRVILAEIESEKRKFLHKGQLLEGVIIEVKGKDRFIVQLSDGQQLIANEITLKRTQDMKHLKKGAKVHIVVKRPTGRELTCKIMGIMEPAQRPGAQLKPAEKEAGPAATAPTQIVSPVEKLSLGQRLLRRLWKPSLKEDQQFQATIIQVQGGNKYTVQIPDGRKLIMMANPTEIKKQGYEHLGEGTMVRVAVKRPTDPEPSCKIIPFANDTSGTKGYPALPEEIAATVCEVLINDRAISFVDGSKAKPYPERAAQLINAARSEDEFYRLCTADQEISSVKLFEIADGKDEYTSKPFEAKVRNRINIYQIHYRKGDKFFTLINTQTKFRYEVNTLHRKSLHSDNLEIFAPFALYSRMDIELTHLKQEDVVTQLYLHETTEAKFNSLNNKEKQETFTKLFDYLKEKDQANTLIKHMRRQFGNSIFVDLKGRLIFSDAEYLDDAIANFVELYHTFQKDPARYRNSLSLVALSLLDRYCEDIDLKTPKPSRLRPGAWTIKAFGRESLVDRSVIDAIGHDDAQALYGGLVKILTGASGVDDRIFSFGYTPGNLINPIQSSQLSFIGFTRLHNKGFPLPVILGEVDPDKYFKTDDPTVIGILAYWDEDPMRLVQEGNEKTDAWFFQVSSFSIREEKIAGRRRYFPVMHAGYCYNPKNEQWEYIRFTKPVPLHYARISGLEELIRRKLEMSGFPILEPRPIDEVTTDKALTYKIFRKAGVRAAKQMSFRRRLSTEVEYELSYGGEEIYTLKPDEIETSLKDFIDKNRFDEIVVKPQDESQGVGVKFFSRKHIADAASYIAFLSKSRGVVVEERIESMPLYIDGKRYDWNARIFVSRDENEQLVVSDMVIRYDLYEKRAPVNISTGAETMSIDELADYLKLDAQAKNALYKRMTENGLAQNHALEKYIVFESEFRKYPYAPLNNGSYLRPDFTGSDVIDTGKESVAIEINDGHSGGIWYLKGGHPVDELVKVMVRRAHSFKKTIERARLSPTPLVDIVYGRWDQEKTDPRFRDETFRLEPERYELETLVAARMAYSDFSFENVMTIGVNTASEALEEMNLNKAIEAVSTMRYALEMAADDTQMHLNVLHNLATGCYIRDIILGGDYNQAHKLMEEAMQIISSVDEVQRLGCWQTQMAEKYNNPFYAIDAILVLHATLKLAPDDPKILFNLGSAYYIMDLLIKGDFVEADTFLKEALRNTPEDDRRFLFEIYSLLGGVYYRQHKYEEAISAYKKSIELLEYTDYGEYGEVSMRGGLAATLNNAGRFKEALGHLEWVRRKVINDPAVYMQLGRAYSGLGRYDEALIAFDAGLRLDPNNVNIRLRAATTHIAKGNLKEALWFLEEALAKAPGYLEVYIAFSDFAMYVGDFDLAINYARQAKKIDPTDYRPYFNIGKCYLQRLQKFREAAEQLQIAAGLNPGYEEIWSELGIAYFNMRHWDEAGQCFKRASELAGKNAHSHFTDGLLFMTRREYPEAAEAFKKARQTIEPDNPNLLIICFYEAWAQRELGNLDESEALLDEAEKLDANAINFPRHQLLTERGRLCMARGRYQEALEYFACAHHTSGGDDSAVTFLYLAQAYEKLGNEHWAQDYYQKLARAFSCKDSFEINYYPYSQEAQIKALELDSPAKLPALNLDISQEIDAAA